MNQTEYKHELIMPNDSIPVKIFSFSAHNDLRIIPSHWHRSAEILYVRRGKLNIWMNKRKYELNRNDFIYINSKEVHSTQSPEDNEVIVLQIPGDFLKTFSNNESLYIHCNTLELKDNKIFSAICEYIKEHYQYNLTLNEVASEFGYSPQYLSRMFQMYTGSTFLTYLNSIRLNSAFKQVMSTDLSIITIAENNGFANVKSLNKLFKETYGLTPSAYRKSIKNDN